MDRPPDSPKIQRSWLRDGLRSDMTEINNRMPNAFLDEAFQRADAIAISGAQHIANSYKRVIWPFNISDDNDVRMLADFYFHTRAQAAKDLQRFQRQLAGGGQFPGQLPNAPQAGAREAELKAAQAEGDAILDLAEKLAQRTGAVRTLTALIYASLPAACLRQGQQTPVSYFHFDPDQGSWSYVGPAYEAYARRYAARYHDRHAIPSDKKDTVVAAPVQLPTWFPRQPDCIAWNRMNALRSIQGMGGVPTRQNGVWPGFGNNGNFGSNLRNR
jgi:hypothetical protein